MKYKYFEISANESGTYNIANRKGEVFEWGYSVPGYYGPGSSKYIVVSDKDGKESLYNYKGDVMPAAVKADKIYVRSDGSYRVVKNAQEQIYDNGATFRRKCKMTAKILAALCILGGLLATAKQCHNDKQRREATENSMEAVFIGTHDSRYYLSTDKNDKDAEYYAIPQSDYARGVGSALNRGDKQPLGDLRNAGFNIYQINNKANGR